MSVGLAVFSAVHMALTVALLVLLAAYAMPVYFAEGPGVAAVPPALVAWLTASVGPVPLHVVPDAAAAAALNARLLAKSAYIHLAMAVATYATVTYVIIVPFGRHAANTWVTVQIPARLSWVLQECPGPLNIAFFTCVEYPLYHSGQQGYVAAVWEGLHQFRLPLVLFVIHYLHRSFVYPAAVSSRANRVPLHVTWSATLYCLFNGRLQVLASLALLPAETSLSRLPPLLQCAFLPGGASGFSAVGVAAACLFAVLFGLGTYWFFAGMEMNMRSDYYLVALKDQTRRGGGSDGYQIPRGGWFERVSCPNFLGEIIEWAGYAAVVLACTWGAGRERTRCDGAAVLRSLAAPGEWAAHGAPALAAFSFLVYVVANLVPRAIAHHEWYRRRFPHEYDALSRHAIFPGAM